MPVFAVYAHGPRSPHWELQDIFESQEEAEHCASALVQMPGGRPFLRCAYVITGLEIV